MGQGVGTGTLIAGLGAVTGYGWGVGALVAGLRDQRTAATPADVDGLKVTAALAPEVPPPGAEPFPPEERYERVVRHAVDEALAEARAHGWTPGPTVGLVFCTGIGDIRTMRDNYFTEGVRPRPGLFPRVLHTSIGSVLAKEHGWTGPNVVLNAACSSGNAALQTAQLWLDAGVATDVVVAGAELCVIGEIVTGFRRMRVLLGDHHPVTDCRPFQEGSRGFFLGEASVAMVVTPRADGGRAAVLGAATTHDAHHLVAAEPSGRELERCLREALDRAGVAPGDVGLVKAHGSGTPLNDTIESALADRLFPPETRLCSYKPLVGHCMAASALAELACVLAGPDAGVLPAHVTADPAHSRLADADPFPGGPVACLSVGLGGVNAAAILDIRR
jgi:3-oxoacyl-[acyl-carrier-protein] synthase II